jgi:hypothetical protein
MRHGSEKPFVHEFCHLSNEFSVSDNAVRTAIDPAVAANGDGLSEASPAPFQLSCYKEMALWRPCLACRRPHLSGGRRIYQQCISSDYATRLMWGIVVETGKND